MLQPLIQFGCLIPLALAKGSLAVKLLHGSRERLCLLKSHTPRGTKAAISRAAIKIYLQSAFETVLIETSSLEEADQSQL